MGKQSEQTWHEPFTISLNSKSQYTLFAFESPVSSGSQTPMASELPNVALQFNFDEQSKFKSDLDRIYYQQQQQTLQQQQYKQYKPVAVHLKHSHCKTFSLLHEVYQVPLKAGGFLPMDRKCTFNVFAHSKKSKGVILLIPGFASNRKMFDVGGGKGKSGISFMEFLVKRGYDVFSIDLRGTVDAKKLGCTGASNLVEYVEHDIPTAIKFIQKLLLGTSKIYLIGHSLGGALSLAVTGVIPNDIAGVVHLAGLYNPRVPVLVDMIEMYEKLCPSWIKGMIEWSVVKSLKAVESMLTSKEEPRPFEAQTDNTNRVESKKCHGRCNSRYMGKFLDYLSRQPIPVRTGVEMLLYMRKFVPDSVLEFFVHNAYPSPWLPYSLEDPFGLLEQSAESPSIGITLSVAKAGVHTEMYNRWVLDNSRMGDLGMSTDEEESEKGQFRKKFFEMKRQAKSESELTEALIASSSNANTRKMKAKLSDTKEETNKKSTAFTPSTAVSMLFSQWNELAPYFSRFEKLVHLPLFFCYANADAILRPRDNISGFFRSKSRWMEIIKYVKYEESVNSGADRVTLTKPEDDEEPVLRKTNSLTKITVANRKRYSVSEGMSSGQGTRNSSVDQYSIPASLTYGHCDILAGKNAEKIWEKIGNWLDITATRETEWELMRRYSAK
ncbi:hypothetical protein HK098_003305 [Nowakowskiella sp. JEL0407]|nr:hypothetical protein HK098_003305 [Nowakowskiella sp. JEL0407]